MLVSFRPGALTCWGNAYLGGAASLDECVERTVHADALHRVTGVPDEPDAVSLAVALGRLRASGVTGLRLVLPEPGDPTGLPGPRTTTDAAVAAGCAVLTVGPPEVAPLALVPTVSAADRGDVVRWDVHAAAWAVPPAGLPSLAEADRGLSEALRATTADLDALDVASGRDAVGPRLVAIDRSVRRIDLPASLPARAQRMVAGASRLLGILTVAAEGDGAAVTAGEAAGRAQALRPLRTAARYALCAGYSAAAEPPRGGDGAAR
ncbi:MAG: hypothetical protein GC157_00960 [Frankiales bacterium]|nr:hypothetical protein [Frankiales bacterium]